MPDGPVCPECEGPVEFMGGQPVGRDRVVGIYLCGDPACETTQVTVITDA